MRNFCIFSSLLLLASFTTAFDQLLLRPSPSARRLIQYGSDDRAPLLMTEAEIDSLRRHGIKFMDVTDTVRLQEQELKEFGTIKVPAKIPLPTQLVAETQVNAIATRFSKDWMKEFATKFTSFNTRYYRSTTGKQSQQYLLGVVKESIDTYRGNLTITEFKHDWGQHSIVARIEGKGSKKRRDETVIVGAHQDSVNMWLPSFGRSPGADDDNSGTVTLLEAFRALTAAQWEPKRSVEFHWYAAEEAGLLGSQAIAQAYRKENRNIVGMLQTDMDGYPKKQPNYGLVTDFVDPELTEFLRKLATKYTTLKIAEMKCGYGCSDHASFNKAGFRSAFHFESDRLEENPNVHTDRDSVDTLDFDHMLQYAKVIVGFAVELGLGDAQ